MQLKTWICGGVPVSGFPANFGLLVLRVVTGLGIAFGHGLGKIPPGERFVAGVAEMGFPWPALFAWAAGLSELGGGLLLALGLATRPASLFIFVTMMVAAVLRHADDPFSGKEKALLYACVSLLFLLMGAARPSLDALIRKR
jgi:putative oxidoreductase